jgi:hypothetical protein
VPFFTLSPQFGSWQILPRQTPLLQSDGTVHVFGFGQRGHPGTGIGPPQSTSLSPWFLTVSEQVGCWQVLFGATPVHTTLVQSPATTQDSPGSQSPQVPPPQSMSVSAPFFTLSPHVGAWQVLFGATPVQTPLWQSPATTHVLPTPQSAQGPPQSTSLSPWFFTPSPQVGAAHWPLLQTPLAQSLAPRHVFAAAQRGHGVAPPQSASLSP